MLSTQGYWFNRYSKQGSKTVGNCSFSQEQFEQKSREVVEVLLSFLCKCDIVAKRFLDFGCGTGRMTKALIPFFLEVYGIDIVPWAIGRAQESCPRGRFKVYDGLIIPFEDCYFEGALTWTVLQHIPEDNIQEVCKEISRVIMRGRKFLSYENISVWHSNTSHIWFRSIEAYEHYFPDFKLINSQIVHGADGNDEDHALMLFKKDNK